jgi:uncharacterized protein with von Willebrand factor type A (vWA) domain
VTARQALGQGDGVALAVGFARTLEAAGVAAGPERVATFVEALAGLRPEQCDDVYWAGRLTLCANPADFERYDRVFSAYFSGEHPPVARRRQRVHAVALPVAVTDPARQPAQEESGEQRVPALAAASAVEVLRQRDVSNLTATDREALRRLLAAFGLQAELRRSRRYQPASRGRVDPGRTVRDMLARGGETALIRHRTHRRRPRRVVLLVDVSGSMAPYADALLRFAHAAARATAARVEVFTIGTRLTRVTKEMTSPDPDAAMASVAATVPDWSGGTRLGDLLKEFLDRWGQRGMARGAVVVILSDGWERGDAAALGEQMARLQRLAHRVVWANPRKARPGFEPLAAGMAAALPHVDAFVSGHSLAALEHLAEVVAGRA